MVNNKLVLSLWGRGNAIYMSRGVVRALGIPAFVSIRVTEDLTSVAVVASEAKEILSFKVPETFSEKRNGVAVYSKSFLDNVMPANKLDRFNTYQCEGHYSAEQNVVFFKIADMKRHDREFKE